MDSQTLEKPDDPSQHLAELLRDNIRVRTNGSIRGLEVTVNGESIVIAGRTSRYYYKQLATSAVLAAAQQHELSNQIEVASES